MGPRLLNFFSRWEERSESRPGPFKPWNLLNITMGTREKFPTVRNRWNVTVDNLGTKITELPWHSLGHIEYNHELEFTATHNNVHHYSKKTHEQPFRLITDVTKNVNWPQ